MFSLIGFIVNAKFIIGAVVGGALAVVYFSFTGSTLNWKKKKK